MSEQFVSLASGSEIPVMGLGTWNLDGEEVRQSVRTALEEGYKHIDTAEGYGNEAIIGDVLQEFERGDIWLTTKVLPKNLNYESVLNSCKSSLEKLQTDYLDLFLIHWPNPAISLRETLEAMKKLYDEGYVKNVGVSNFSAYQLSCAHHISEVPIVVNQIEYHPWYTQDSVVEYCRKTNTIVEAAAPLGRTAVFNDPVIQNISEKVGQPRAVVALRWAINNGVVVLPKSSSAEHIINNRIALDWNLSDSDQLEIDSIQRNEPVYDFPSRDWERPKYGIST
jgi:diketogulonate reductase-like aldo/keto reductase